MHDYQAQKYKNKGESEIAITRTTNEKPTYPISVLKLLPQYLAYSFSTPGIPKAHIGMARKPTRQITTFRNMIIGPATARY